MFDELAQNPEDAEDYDLEALEHRDGPMRISDNDDDASTLVGRAGGSMAEDAVVFDIGDDEGDDDEPAKKRRGGGVEHEGEAHERQGLMKDD